jgi:hypothetical protein
VIDVHYVQDVERNRPPPRRQHRIVRVVHQCQDGWQRKTRDNNVADAMHEKPTRRRAVARNGESPDTIDHRHGGQDDCPRGVPHRNTRKKKSESFFGFFGESTRMSGDDRLSRLEARIASIEALQNAALGVKKMNGSEKVVALLWILPERSFPRIPTPGEELPTPGKLLPTPPETPPRSSQATPS